ncbi:hypothetical protein JYT22_00330 [Endomicrobium sp. AH-315-J14]|nr:hypothetical protein [Endomicrobium sp. AH-315-J14]
MTDAATRALDLAERVADAFAQRGISAPIIGATAMAAHGYTRATMDIDLGTVGVPIATLREIAVELRAEGLRVDLREPDADDPLGGLLRVAADGEVTIDVVNFGNPMTGATHDVGTVALGAPKVPLSGRRLEVVSVESLVLLKLAAGSRLDLRDAAELLARHDDVDREALRLTSAALHLDRRLERVLADLSEDD